MIAMYRSVLNAINRYNHSPHSLVMIRNCHSLIGFHHTFKTQMTTVFATQLMSRRRFRLQLSQTTDKRRKRLKEFEKDMDILGAELIKCTSISQWLELIGSHHSMMNNRHIIESFETLLNLSSDSSIDMTEVLSTDEFRVLCSRAIKRIRLFNPKEILTYMRAIVFNKQPATMLNTEITQSFLKTASESLNDFRVNQLLFLDYLLEKFALFIPHEQYFNGISNFDNRLVEDLKLALPLVLQAKTGPNELNYDDIDLVIECLRFSCKHNLEHIIVRLVAALPLNIDLLTNEQCFKIVSAFSFLQNEEIDARISEVIVDCLDKATAITTSELLSLKFSFNLVVELTHFVKNKRVFYHKGLFDLVANFILEYPTKVDVKRAIYLLESCEHYHHIHYGLIDYISEQICNNHEIVNDPKMSFNKILKGFAMPPNYYRNKMKSTAIYDMIIDSASVTRFRTQHGLKSLLFEIIRSLCILGYYPQDFVKDCVFNHLEEAVNNSTSIISRAKLLSNIVTLYQYLSIDNINDSNKSMIERLKPYIDEYVLKLFDKYNDNSSTSLSKFLSEGLGGQQFVANCIFTDFGHFIDHLVVMSECGCPVEIGNIDKEKICFVKDLSLPSDCKIIGVIGMKKGDYCRHPFILKGRIDYRIKTLKNTGILPVIINLESFESLQESEKIPFLMTEIKHVLQQSEPKTDIILN